MLSDVIHDLVDGECIIAAALIDADGFTLERTSIDLKPNELAAIFDICESHDIISVVTTENILTARLFSTNHTLIIQTPKNGNIGMARLRLEQSSKLIVNYLE